MSKLQLSPNPSGAGIVTLAAPNTASDVTLTLPAVTAELITNSSGVLNIGSGQLVKDASGNLGLGVTPSAWGTLKAIDISTWASFAGFTNQASVLGNAYYDGSNYRYKQTAVATRYEQNNSGTHTWFNAPSGTAGNAISFTQAMTLDANGSLALGATSVGGGSRLTIKQGAAQLDIATGSANVSFESIDRGAVGNAITMDYYARNGSHVWYGGAYSERARIDTSGRFMVGTSNTDPTFNRVNGFIVLGSGNFLLRANNPCDMGRDVTSGIHISFYTDNGSARVTAGNISSNGGTTTYATSSDYRMKENVQSMTGALDKVLALKPVTYAWKPEFAGTNPNGQGFIAHELQEVVPDCVTGEKDAVDENGKPQYQGVDTSFLVATLVSAIQELTARLEVLENK